MRAPTPLTLAGGAVALGAAGLTAGRTGLRMAQATGSSLAAPDASPWVTDLLNAAYYARPEAERDVDDLRLAAALLATRWEQLGRRLHAPDVLGFHRAFVGARLRGHPRGTLDRAALLAGGAQLLGNWFPTAYADPARRAYGIVFETEQARAAFDPAARTRDAALGALTPPSGPPEARVWHTYAPVAVPDPEALVALLHAPARWPDAASALGRFTPLAAGGLPGQTFEIDLVADLTRRTPVLTRGYVTCTAAVGQEDPEALAAWVADLDAGGDAIPAGATVHAGIDLTTHAGHPLGAAISRLAVWTDQAGSWIRDVGVWDPLPTPTRQAYRLAGRRAQAAFWGEGTPAESFLHQLALVSAGA